MNKLFTCEHCFKEFKKQGFYKKHISICEIVNSREKDDKFNIEFCNEDMVSLVKMLLKKQKKMESELQSLKMLFKKTNSKLTLLEWINENYKEHIAFDVWLNNLEINDSNIEFIFDNTLLDGLFEIVTSNIFIENDNSPLLSFIQKSNSLYVFMNNKWQLMDNKYFEKVIDSINSKIFKKFNNLQSQNKFTDEQYTDNVRKIMGGETTKNSMLCKLRCKLFNHFKINLNTTDIN